MGIRAFLALCLLALSAVTSADSTTPTGFYYPIGTDNLDVPLCGRWLTKPEGSVSNSNEDCYFGVVYHTGVDITAGYGTAVRAISDGVVLPWSPNGWSDEGKSDNIALLIRHRSNEYGDFVALYGHVRKSDAKSAGSSVKAGEVIGYIGHWEYGDHLHFGVLSPGLTLPLDPRSFGRWDYSKYGVKDVLGYFDNGLIDPIDFIVYNGPDNYRTRSDESVPNPITTESSWFYDLCWYTGSEPDSRCDLDGIMMYIECTLEKSTLCAVDPSVWSALHESGKTSGNTYGVGGDGYNGNPTQTNLTFDFDILDLDGNELYAGRDTIGPMTVKLRVQAIAEHDNAGNWKTRDNADTIEIDYFVRFDGGEWIKINRGYMTIGKLDKGVMIQETYTYTIPNQTTTSVEFKTKGDAEDEIDESDEGDNTSRIESFAYDVNASSLYSPDMVIKGLGLTNGRTQLTQGGRFGLQAWPKNIGGRKAAASRMAYYLQTPGGGLNYVMDDGVDELGPGQESWELTGDEPFTANVSGWWHAYATADYQGNVTEGNENNNGMEYWFYVVPAMPDLVVEAMWLAEGSTVKKDTRVHPYCVVKNIGNGNAGPSRLAYYIDQYKYRDGDDVGSLCPGCSATEHVMNDNIRLGDKGGRTYRCCVDNWGAVPESNESNNCATSNFTVR